jgi:hypothetical protein
LNSAVDRMLNRVDLPPLIVRAGVIVRLLVLVGLGFFALIGAGNASPDKIRRPCCYAGALTLAHLQQLRFVMDDGSEQSFDQVYKGFETHQKGRRPQFPFRKIGISGLVYDVLSVVFPQYDANKDGFIEEPELTVLYLREGARGMGFKVSHLVVEERVDALQTSPADVGGLVSFINAHKAGMSKEARSLFAEIDYLTAQIQRRGIGAADQTFLGP